ncbi:MAG TPA: VOC family protein [Actinomycetota bacterium]|nr:VOC family protein [Actinomycetota bacterium]
MPTITPHLWFEKEGREAAELYCSIFPDSRILSEETFESPPGAEGPPPTFSQVTFELCGQRVIALSAGPTFELDEAFSFFVECETQEEVDEYWDKLTANGGEESVCGWLKDRYGLSWQIVPKLLGELMQDEDKDRAHAVMQAMLKMKKIDCAALQEAYNQPVNA